MTGLHGSFLNSLSLVVFFTSSLFLLYLTSHLSRLAFLSLSFLSHLSRLGSLVSLTPLVFALSSFFNSLSLFLFLSPLLV